MIDIFIPENLVISKFTGVVVKVLDHFYPSTAFYSMFTGEVVAINKEFYYNREVNYDIGYVATNWSKASFVLYKADIGKIKIL